MTTEKITFFQRLKKIFKWWVIVLIGLLIIARILLPYIVLNYVNKTLQEMEGYTGHVDDIDIWLIRGAYIIKDIHIEELVDKKAAKIPFFKSEIIDLSLEWSAIFKGRIVGKVTMENALLNFKQKKTDPTSFEADTADFRQLVRNLMPLTINRFKLNNGEIHYIDQNASPNVDIKMTDLNAIALNLSNVEKKKNLLPSSIAATGKAYGGDMSLNMKLDPLNKKPIFDLNLEIKNAQLPQMNEFLKAYGNITVDKGSFGLYTELAGKDNKVAGYVKPLIKDLHVEQWKKEDNIGGKVWSLLVAGVAKIFTNYSKDQIGTRVNINGEFNNPDIGIWTAIKYVIVNAWIQALSPHIEQKIDIQNVNETQKKGFLDKLFGGKEKEKSEEGKRKK